MDLHSLVQDAQQRVRHEIQGGYPDLRVCHLAALIEAEARRGDLEKARRLHRELLRRAEQIRAAAGGAA